MENKNKVDNYEDLNRIYSNLNSGTVKNPVREAEIKKVKAEREKVIQEKQIVKKG